MLPVFDSLRNITLLSTAVRVITAYICGLLIGMERSYKNRPAGFRTHILVCLGAAIAAMCGEYLYLNLHLPTDISRIGAQVVSGLGFIGAGTIIVTRNRTVKGLTTAAGLWSCGIIGLAIGAGFYEGGITGTILILFTETVFYRLSKRIGHMPEFEILLHYREKQALADVMRYCKDNRLAIANLHVVTSGEGDKLYYTARVLLRPNHTVHQDTLLAHIRGINGVMDVEVS